MDRKVESIAASRPEQPDWNQIAKSARFQHLLAVKRRFIIPVFLFFLVYYLLLPILLGCVPELMSTRLWETVTLAYVFALSQFVVAWAIAWLYLRASTKFDVLIRDVFIQKDAPPGEK
jgi:uncharacterized membrane protein (DUF485 family)